MTEISARREEAQKAILDLFAATTGLPIGLYELRDGQFRGIFSGRSLANFEPHCRFIQSLPSGKAACESDMCQRANTAQKSREEQLTICHAGLYNQAVPVEVEGEVRAVLFYGEMLIEGDEYRQKALERHRQAVSRLNLSEDQAAELRQFLLTVKEYSPQQLEILRSTLPKIEQWFYLLEDEEERMKRSIEKVTHEIQTRLQAVIANAENLFVESHKIDSDEARKRLGELLSSALALDTVVQNLEEYLEDYRFRKQPIAPLLHEAKRLYEAEANRRGVDIYIQLHRVNGKRPELEISRHHLQYALNNLMHNAIKYSFRGGPGRNRFVRISGFPTGDSYKLSFQNYGVGILPEEIESGAIFQDGYQGQLTEGEYRTGSGKGLCFAKRVIDRHHGQIEVESTLMGDQEDNGRRRHLKPHLTRFVVYLPYKQPEEK